MNAFVVQCENRPGEIARVTEKLAARGVNLLLCGLGAGQWGAIGFIASDEAAARLALGEAAIGSHEVPVLFVSLEDKPGQAADASRRLADAGVNLGVFLPVDRSGDRVTIAIGVDNVEAARRALGDQVTDFSYA